MTTNEIPTPTVMTGDGIDLTPYIIPGSVQWNDGGDVTAGVEYKTSNKVTRNYEVDLEFSRGEVTFDKVTEAMSGLGDAFKLADYDWGFLSEILAAGLTPQEELRYRVQERANGRDPGEPVNTAQWRVW